MRAEGYNRGSNIVVYDVATSQPVRCGREFSVDCLLNANCWFCVSKRRAMRNHHTPAYYLRGFTIAGRDDDSLWVHDRLSARSFEQSPRTTGRQNDLYSDQLEHHFTYSVEVPANPVIDKVRALHPLTASDREALANYIVALHRRGVVGRMRVRSELPTTAAAVREAIHRRIDQLVVEDSSLLELGESRKTEIEAPLKSYTHERTDEIWHESLMLDTSRHVLDALLSMDWHYVRCRSAPLLTSDNPVFMFDEGLNGPKSEMTIPISRSVALWLTKTAAGSQVVTATRNQEKELNRRTARNAARFLYSATSESWILPLHCKAEFSLHRWELLGGR